MVAEAAPGERSDAVALPLASILAPQAGRGDFGVETGL